MIPVKLNITEKVSIITVTLNSEKHIKNTMRSVLNQTYKNIEYIIIDGCSTDNTIKCIKEIEPQFKGRLKWISEPDMGIYDAMNKGIKMASGKVVGLLNSDDWYHNKAIEMLMKNYEEDIDIYNGDIYFVREAGEKFLVKTNIRNSLDDITRYMSINHPACFVHRRWYSKIIYDDKYRIAADYKFILASFLKGAKFKYIKYYFTYMRIGGISAANINAAKEVFLIKKELLGKTDLFTFIHEAYAIYSTKMRMKISSLLPLEYRLHHYETKGWVLQNDKVQTL